VGVPDAVILYATLAACALFTGWVVVRYDLYDKEPVRALATAVASGAVLMFLAGRAQVALIHLGVDHWHEWLGTWYYLVLAGVFEELAKVASVGVVAMVFRRHFNDPIDGLIYGAFAGLGAALEESVWLLGFDVASPFLPWQEPVRLAGHLVMGGIGGWGMGALTGRPGPARWMIPASLSAAVGLHILWDVAAFEGARLHLEAGGAPAWTTGMAMAIMLGGMLIFRALVGRGSRMSAGRFAG
jgi:RsiW-degrading membrane proteinase PrsW (M82 family)